MTRPTDRYVWHHAPGQNHLFSKQLSKHNIGAYREICRELGKSIQVVSIDREQNGNGCAADESNLFRAGRGMTSDDLHGTKGLDHRVSDVCSDLKCLLLIVQYFVDLTRTVQTLEAETADLRGQLDEALSLCEERGRSVEELQADSGRMKRQFSHLQATLHLRNAEATRRTHLLETNARRLQQLGGLLRDWEREVA